MQDLKTKIREVYLPFLLAVAGTILGYTLARWALLAISLQHVPFNVNIRRCSQASAVNYWR